MAKKRGPSRPRPRSNGRAPSAKTPPEPEPKRARPWRRLAAIGLAVVAAYFLVIRAAPPGRPSEAALAAASDAGCSDLERPVVANPSREHLSSGQAHTYPDPPAASARIQPVPLRITAPTPITFGIAAGQNTREDSRLPAAASTTVWAGRSASMFAT